MRQVYISCRCINSRSVSMDVAVIRMSAKLVTKGRSFYAWFTSSSSSGQFWAPVLVSVSPSPLEYRREVDSLSGWDVWKTWDGPKPWKPVLTRKKWTFISCLFLKFSSDGTIVIPITRITNIICVKANLLWLGTMFSCAGRLRVLAPYLCQHRQEALSPPTVSKWHRRVSRGREFSSTVPKTWTNLNTILKTKTNLNIAGRRWRQTSWIDRTDGASEVYRNFCVHG